MDFIRLLEQSSPMVWLREGGSLWGYPAILFMHTLGLGTVAGVSTAMALRFLGFGHRIPLASLRPMFGLVWAALVVTALSGLVLLIADASTKLRLPVFYIKMLFVAAAVLCLHRMKQATAVPETAAAGSPARIWVLGSLFCWAAAVTGGRLMAYLGDVSGLG